MAVSVRIGRAKSQRDKVLFCGYHGWHDWYLAANLADEKSLDGHLLSGLAPSGVPRALKGTSYPFKYNDTEGFLKLIKEHKEDVGVVVLESLRDKYPDKEFIQTVRQITRDLGIVLICDEITAGFRLSLGGAHLLFDLEPDIAVFGKAISNGYPMAAIIGKAEVMEAAQDSFISSTYWTDRVGPTAALSTIKKMRDKKVSQHLVDTGEKIQIGWKEAAANNKLALDVSGIYPLSHFNFNYKEPLVLKTLFTQIMLEKGFLASTAFYASYAHKEDHVDEYLKSVDESFSFIAQAIKGGNPEKHLKGTVCHSGFKRLT